MPVDFVTDVQQAGYGQYPETLSDQELAQYFYLDAAARQQIATCRGAANRLGYALQLTSVRYLGIFPDDVRAIPSQVLTYVAHQIPIPDMPDALEYYQQGDTRWEHRKAIRASWGVHEFIEGSVVFPLVRLLYLRAWVNADRPSVLFDVAKDWLMAHRVILPGISTLERLIARIRERVTVRQWQQMSRLVSPDQQQRLERLLQTESKGQPSLLDQLRQSPTRISAPSLVQALERIDQVRAFGVADIDISAIPTHRLKTLAAYAMTSKAATIASLQSDRRIATLLAFVHTLEQTSRDDALEVLDQVLDDLMRSAQQANKKERLRTLRDLDEAALTLATIDSELLAHPNWTRARIRAFLEGKRAAMQGAIAQIQQVARPPGERYQQELRSRYATVRRFLPKLLATIDFAMAPAARPLQEAHQFLHQMTQQKRLPMEQAPLDFVPASWRRHVAPAGKPLDRQMYTLCFISQLQEGLRKRDVFVTASSRWSDPRAKLLHGAAWEAVRATISQVLGRSLSADDELARWEQDLDAAYRRTCAALPTASVQFERVHDPATGKDQDHLVISPLDAIPDPLSLQRLRNVTNRRLPLTDLPMLLMEMETRTGFVAEFTHIGDVPSQIPDLPISLCAVLMAQACNLPMSAVTQVGVPGLERDRLLHVQQNYVRPETIARANARLVAFHRAIPLSAVWGGGEVASADGIRFVVPIRTLNAGPNRKYFGTGRGITLFNYTLNNFFGFNGAVIPGTIRDSLYILDGLLQQNPSLHPTTIMTDTASYSDIVFGCFALLGYRFSPRIADTGESRFWRMTANANYGPLNAVSQHQINRKLIATQWEDVLRVVGSLKYGTIRAFEALRMLQGGGRPTTLGRAIGEIGRIAKSFHLLDVVSSDVYRRAMLIQLNRGEGRHSLSRAVFHGRHGELRQPYREGQEEQLGALGFVVNLIVLWNTLYLDAALADMQQRGRVVDQADIERLSPLGYEHIRFHGNYSFTLSQEVSQGQLLPLRAWAEDA